MHIVHIINNLGRGGAEKLLVDLLPHIKRLGVQVEVVLLNQKKSDNRYIAELLDNGIDVHDLKVERLKSLKLIKSVSNFIKRKVPHEGVIIHAHLFPTLYAVALSKYIAKWSNPILLTEHSSSNKRAENALLKPLEQFVYKRFNAVICISKAIQSRLTGSYNLKNTHLIRNGVDTSEIANMIPYKRHVLLDELKLDDDAVLLMMTARFNYPKDHKTFVAALDFLPQNYHALIAGDGDGMDEFDEFLRGKRYASRVKKLGFRLDARKLMKSVDLNVLSSQYEGMSGVTLEGLASEIPFLGSDVLGINDVVPHKKFLFEAGNAKDLADKILSIQRDDDLRQRMKREAINKVAEFDMKVMVHNYIKLYQDI